MTFGAGLLIGTALGTVGTVSLDFLFGLIGMSSSSSLFKLAVWLLTVAVLYAVNTALMAGLFRFLTGTKLTWRRILPGAFLGAAATTVLQLGFGLFLGYTPTNTLLVTFIFFIVLLLWFRLIGIVLLVAASWIAVGARDNHVALIPQTEAERLAKEHQALLLAAQVRLRTAVDERASAPWFRRWAADRALRDAQEELTQVEAAAPPKPAPKRGLLSPHRSATRPPPEGMSVPVARLDGCHTCVSPPSTSTASAPPSATGCTAGWTKPASTS
ncbi:YihY/virulence factor BrkB family protein [Microbacterium sp. KUDC0406]|uniref:YihY/virulence factor BrkB family protein n=1 Tax=Microbacterium sp. KUDC0406 TaxID=2909588 RepID=UPI001F448294|nr:YihY/virulence factor BrkB family protein [Microbacterium sp. KUDC0406]UJP11634.1 YihY/virulence factor BrkB family protein [Microbacterium sp. KUDC0406]